MTKPIRIRLTKEYLVMLVDLEQLRRGSSMRSFWGLGWVNFRKYLDVQAGKRKKLLIGYSLDTLDGNNSRMRYFLWMHDVAILSDWTVVRYVSLGTHNPTDVISQCLVICRTEKPS